MPSMSENDVLAEYHRAHAVWFYPYDAHYDAPHAILASGGRHSDGYVDSDLVFSYPDQLDRIAQELAFRVMRLGVWPDWVVGSAYAAITFSAAVARHLGARHGYAERGEGAQRWRRLAIPAGATVLQVEDVVTTGETADQVRAGIMAWCETERRDPPLFLQLLATAVYRPRTESELDRPDIVALVRRVVRAWPADVCELCQKGSPALHPKPNWQRFVGRH